MVGAKKKRVKQTVELFECSVKLHNIPMPDIVLLMLSVDRQNKPYQKKGREKLQESGEKQKKKSLKIPSVSCELYDSAGHENVVKGHKGQGTLTHIFSLALSFVFFNSFLFLVVFFHEEG